MIPLQGFIPFALSSPLGILPPWLLTNFLTSAAIPLVSHLSFVFWELSVQFHALHFNWVVGFLDVSQELLKVRLMHFVLWDGHEPVRTRSSFKEVCFIVKSTRNGIVVVILIVNGQSLNSCQRQISVHASEGLCRSVIFWAWLWGIMQIMLIDVGRPPYLPGDNKDKVSGAESRHSPTCRLAVDMWPAAPICCHRLLRWTVSSNCDLKSNLPPLLPLSVIFPQHGRRVILHLLLFLCLNYNF